MTTIFRTIRAPKASFLALFLNSAFIGASFFAALFVALPSHAHAALQPSFSLTPVASTLTQSAQAVQIAVTGDANAAVQLFYYNGGFSLIGSIGNTDSNGYFTTTVPYTQYNIQPGVSVYIVVDGMQSATIQWPYFGGSVSSTPPVYINQTTYNSTPSYNYPSGYPYNYNNGYNNGTYYNPGGYVTPLSFSQNSVSMNAGSSRTVTIYGQGSYYISTNQGSYVASASVSGSQLYIYGYNPGSTTVTVCQNYGSCARPFTSRSSPRPSTIRRSTRSPSILSQCTHILSIPSRCTRSRASIVRRILRIHQIPGITTNYVIFLFALL